MPIQDRPIQFDSLREALSLAYLKEHHGLEKERAEIIPKVILIHHTVIPSLDATFEAFDPPLLPSSRAEIIQSSALNVSAHFGVDQDGTIYRFLPETSFARHVIGLNYCAIGVENVGGGPDLPLTQAQLAANISLVFYLKKKFPDIEYLIGHHEYQAFFKHPLWKESDPNYLTKKNDPGPKFMEGIRKELKALKLKGPPDEKSMSNSE
ncbi:MAG: peptidoglycan recognition family protein [Bacteroidota bacterium]